MTGRPPKAVLELNAGTMSNAKKVVLITGVSREQGIGFGLGKRMAETDFDVIITARKKSNALSLAKLIGLAAVAAEEVDITDDESVRNLATLIERDYGKLDILVNNAAGGLDYGIPVLSTDLAVTRDALETNLFGAWRMIKAFHPLLKKSAHPRIVNISSGAGSFSHPVFGLSNHPAILTSYAISKLALNGLTVKAAAELRADNILINSVNPGFVATAPGMEKMGARSVRESVNGIIWAATLPDDGPTGKFFEDGSEIGW
jgi:NAD(P)-dependent dehydrogenase (short-subunit alcohol dehydrogenase family)